MIRLVRCEENMSSGYAPAREDEGSPSFLPMDEHLFTAARTAFAEEPEAALFTRDSRDGTAFRLVTEPDRYAFKSGDLVEANLNFHGCDLIRERSRLDMSLVDRFGAYHFEELNEYTFEIARFLLYARPDRPVTFSDPRAEAFFPKGSIRITASAAGTGSGTGAGMNSGNDPDTDPDSRCMIVETYIPGAAEDGVRYDCRNVLSSLCWARNHRRYGDKNAGRTILLIDFYGGGGGFGDIVRTAQTYAHMAEDRGWIPAVRVRNTQYSADPEKNVWDLYFRQPGPVSVEEALESADVVAASENDFQKGNNIASDFWNPYFRWREFIRKPLLLREDLERRFRASELGRILMNEYVPGVIARGTDLLRQAKENSEDVPSPETVLESAELLLKVTGAQRLFLATEDEEVFRLFSGRFGDRILSVPQKRVSLGGGPFHLVADLLEIPDDEKEEWGRTYLFILWCLSRCRVLGFNMHNGSLEAAQRLRAGRDGGVLPAFDLAGRVPELASVGAFARPEKDRYLVYGAGTSARCFLEMFDTEGKEVLIFDRSAGGETKDFFGRKVLPPEAAAEYAEDEILITPWAAKDAIARMLQGFGYRRERMTFFPPTS